MAKEKKERGPQYLVSPLNNNMINYAEYYMSAQEKLFFSIAIIAVGGLVGLVFYGGLFKYEGEATTATYISDAVVFVLIGLIARKFFMPAIANMLKNKRNKKLEKQFIDFLEGLASSLSAGNTVNDAFINARKDLLNQYNENDLIIIELSEIISGMNNGKTLEEMLISFAKRSGNDDIENFGNVISNCYRLGGNFKDVVRKTRDIISDKIAIADEINTKLSSNKLQHNAMCLMPILIVAMLKLLNSTFASNLASPIGIVITTISIGIFVGSYFWGQKIIDIG